jgi:hypothetical protein
MQHSISSYQIVSEANKFKKQSRFERFLISKLSLLEARVFYLM